MTERPHYVVVGLGSIGRRHASNLAQITPEARFTFVRRSGTEDEFTSAFRCRVVSELAEVQDDSPDLVIVATPSANHIDSLPFLIENGWPLMVEKPVVSEARDCQALLDLIEDSPPTVRTVGFNLRYLPSLRHILDEIDGGNVGKVVRATLIAGQSLPTWRPGTDYRTTYSADAATGGGVEMDLAHEFDLARWWFGDLRVISAASGTLSGLEISAHDSAVVTMEPVSGAGPLVVLGLDYVSPQRVRWYEVVGTSQRLEWRIEGALSSSTAAGMGLVDLDPSDFDINGSYKSMLQSFLWAIHNRVSGAHSPQSLVDGISSTRLALEARDWGLGT